MIQNYNVSNVSKTCYAVTSVLGGFSCLCNSDCSEMQKFWYICVDVLIFMWMLGSVEEIKTCLCPCFHFIPAEYMSVCSWEKQSLFIH